MEDDEAITSQTHQVAKEKQPQGELLLDGGPRGKFEGEAPNMVDGEDLDVPAFLRKRK